MNKLGTVSLFVFLFVLLHSGRTFAQATCSTLVGPTFSRPHPCFNDYFTSITASGNMGTTSSISISSGCTDPAYTDLSATQGIDAPVGATVTLDVSRFTTHYTAYVSVYIDWNNNNVFETNEYAGWPSAPTRDVQLGPTEMAISSYHIAPPCGAPAGHFRMRIMLSEALLNLNAPCIATYGQAYDFYYNYFCPSNTLVGDTILCHNDTTILQASYGCGAWTSSNSAIVSVNSSGRIGSGNATGTAIISYTSTACSTSAAVVTVGITPFTGPEPLCIGGTATVNTFPSGGTWNIASSYIASIATDTTECVVTGEHAGTTSLTYSMGGCSWSAAIPILTTMSINGDAVVCLGSTRTLSVITSGGTWSSSNTAKATVSSSGVVSGIAAGTVTISYQAPYGGCWGYKTMTVETTTVTGGTTVCVGATTTLTATPSGGTWSLNPGTAGMTVSSSGEFSGLYMYHDGTSIVTYTSPAGCTKQEIVNVEDRSIILPGAICIGFSAQVAIAVPGLAPTYVSGVTLVSSATSIATVNGTTGYVTGVSAGTAVITYLSSAGCVATTTIAVGTAPTAPTVNICVGGSIDFSPDGDGTWSSSTTPVIINISDALVTSFSAGTTYVTFTPSGSGCPVIHPVIVDTMHSVTGSSTVCQGSTITLSSSGSSGTWSSSNTARATVNSGGVVTGIAGGTVIISHTSGTCTATKTITVQSYATVSGCNTLCQGTNCTITPSFGMTGYSSSNTGVATVTDIGSTNYRVNGIGGGTATITFSTATCAIAALHVVTVNPTPNITGPVNVCPGTPTTLTASPSGGTWSSDNTSIVTINSSGVVSYVAAGATAIDYVSPAGCQTNNYGITAGATIALGGSGVFSFCESTTVGFSATPPGGFWVSSDLSKLSINILDGSAHGNSAGTVTLTYTGAGTCAKTVSVTIKPKPEFCQKIYEYSGSHTGHGGGGGYFGTQFEVNINAKMHIWAKPAGGYFWLGFSNVTRHDEGPGGTSLWCGWSDTQKVDLWPDSIGFGPLYYTTPDGCTGQQSVAVVD